MDKPRRFRLSLGGMLLLVALLAVVIAVMRPRGTRVVDVKAGTGPVATAGSTLLVHYVGKLADGTTVDSSKSRGVPFEFVVGRGSVIKGWDSGILGMRVGGVRRLIIPPEEAYGAQGAPPAIPPDATLTFEVELLKVR
ncbi:FKBP-type peptidyl-prolyl cis-trans isomerase [Tautonia plasticadhaerens]|uniref:Peptidyl-prolyl cis-trans isomerase n=1 Tax=Tautonia plasticadhaerens TaxID=2527974 RepID=A0A518GV01_9BACT|nr:FKBP-type peptidyl-prolyl cis-trans isomerase [Tautonia plasticadhaerens]QDV32408.1 FK506-binding protein [Tautonia plasticadhaerens]